MLKKSMLEDYEALTVREIRKSYESMRPYLDHEIANAYSYYCELFHAAGWTATDLSKFVLWATTAPIDSVPDRAAVSYVKGVNVVPRSTPIPMED